jgi:SAM-dependent methyltransferase
MGGVAPRGGVLDVACGGGRNMRAALAAGHRCVGIDRDLAGVADLAERADVRLIEADLEGGKPFPLAGELFSGVIVTNYLWRPILADIVGAVAADGVLIYETFAAGQERIGRPRNPDFLLRPGELLEAVRARLTPIAFEHRRLAEPERIVQRIVAVGSDHAWRSDPPAWS